MNSKCPLKQNEMGIYSHNHTHAEFFLAPTGLLRQNYFKSWLCWLWENRNKSLLNTPCSLHTILINSIGLKIWSHNYTIIFLFLKLEVCVCVCVFVTLIFHSQTISVRLVLHVQQAALQHVRFLLAVLNSMKEVKLLLKASVYTEHLMPLGPHSSSGALYVSLLQIPINDSSGNSKPGQEFRTPFC